jgi:hypothetical protein
MQARSKPFTMGSLFPMIDNIPDGIPIFFNYNPDELSQRRQVEYEKIQPIGFSHPQYHYKGGGESLHSIEFTVRNFRRIGPGGARIPMSVDLYTALLKDLTLPLRKGNIMISGPPVVLFVLGLYVKKCIITSVGVGVKKWNSIMVEEYARCSMNFAEVRTKNQNRLNSFKGLGAPEL